MLGSIGRVHLFAKVVIGSGVNYQGRAWLYACSTYSTANTRTKTIQKNNLADV